MYRFALRDQIYTPRDPQICTPQHKNVADLGNFFMLWGEPVLGAKKEREKKEKNSLV